jgi:hypothetical protein
MKIPAGHKPGRDFFMVRPAWAHSCGWKSRHKLVTASEAKRNCERETDRGEEAWNVNREPMNKNRIEGVAEQGERAMNREALVTKAKRRRPACRVVWEGDRSGYLTALYPDNRARSLQIAVMKVN